MGLIVKCLSARHSLSSVVGAALLLASCIPEEEAEISAATERMGLEAAYLHYRGLARSGDRERIKKLYVFVLFNSHEDSKLDPAFLHEYDQAMLVYCARLAGERPEEWNYGIPKIPPLSAERDAFCRSEFHVG
jgi:hypothetical protein